MVGAARFVQHFAGQRGSPNCILRFTPAKGFNGDSLALVVHQRNGVGIGPEVPLLLNFGIDFDIEAAKSMTGTDDASFKGALDLLFESQKQHVAVEAAKNVELAAQEETAAKENAAAAQILKDEQAKIKNAEAEAEAALALTKAADKATQEENERKAAEQKRKLDEENAPDAAKRRKAAIGMYDSPKGFSFVFSAETDLLLVGTNSTNAKIPKDGLLAAWGTETTLKKNGEGFAYALTLKTVVYDGQSGKKMTLEKLIKDTYPTTKSIWKYKPFPPGALPKVLQLEDDKKTYQFDSKAANKEIVLKCVERCRTLKNATLLWKMRYRSERLEPDGIVLLANASIVVPGDGEFPLSN